MAIEWFETTQTEVENILLVFRALADPMRLAVFQCIRGCGGAAGYELESGYCDGAMEGGISLCDVRCRMPCAASTLTHHLNTLREAGLIETKKKGRVVYARIRPEALALAACFFALETK
jgi:ArsR family transcriptional regulator, arsenate/arsenite/antimonite-responsive transcriptional repressor